MLSLTNYFPCEVIQGPLGRPKDFVSSDGDVLGPYTIDTIQRHRFGTRYLMCDGRVFKYGKAGATWNPDMGAHTYVGQHVAYTTVAKSTAVGAVQLKIDVAATDGAAAGGLISENELLNGHLLLFPHSSNTMLRRIEGNAAVATGGGEMLLEVDWPLNIATVVDVTHAEAMVNEYADVRNLTSGLRAVVGIPAVPATAGTFGFLQTWGPCWVAPQAEVGDAAHDIQCVFRHDGSIDEHDYSDANVAKQQHAGWVMSHATAGTQGAPFVFLQIGY
jgi:hypothetical protein